MFMRIFNKKGQHTAEYAVMIGIVVAVIMAMQVYIKRGMQGKIKDAVDFMGENISADGCSTVTKYTSQYEPYYAESNYTVGSDRSRKEDLQVGGQFGISGVLENTTRAQDGYQKYLSPNTTDVNNTRTITVTP